MVRPIADDVPGEVREDRLIVIAIRGHRVALAHSRLKVMLAHQAADLLVIDDHAFLPKTGSDTAPAIVLELVTDRCDLLIEQNLITQARILRRRSSLSTPRR
ncbi:hypothetical protein X745_32615 [Mesorhizobium sp. LNJC374B00]|nr:hypothetical protein X745_32615 [Mesorhizobium sp. LNJC374B00]